MAHIIKTGIASYGMSGKLFHAPFIQAHPNYELSAIVERHKEESRIKYPDSKLYRSFEEMISDDTLELIVINTPVQTHFEYAKAALNAGKNIVVEKPFTVNAEEAKELDELAKSKNLLLTVYQNRRYDGDYKAIKDIVQENILGELKEAELRYDRYRTGHSGKDHKEGDKPGAGNLHDLGAHLIDQAIQLFGFPEAVFADVFAMRKDMIANDYFEVLLYYPRPFRVRIKGTVFARESIYPFVINGENGTFMQQRSDLQESRLLADEIPSIETWIPTPQGFDGILHTTINGESVRKETRSEMGNYMDFYSDVYDTLVNDKPNPVPASDAVLTMRVIDAALKSNQEKEWLHYNLVKQI
ncbi:Gfo/Idh/MocA family oxidoreductase [Niabella ginsengisoli]|uniref:Gfo/Idh/MocA family oxidoreductase n=1 Tax=Niabella ginsengisoli TaxID=522298 RepID=A0ABS9SNH1_9BACT|nr:Gfo/Idh/MocA family oxidoreductase [Niabella ginsengisoli]MCH5599948.1 Gfo/Idh/MocA family oxidoreductase [Niabella ginsengisoli]